MKGLWIKTGLLVVAFTGVAFGQVTMDFLGGGARAQGMGKAFYAISDDISAVTWNPAGLAKLEKPILGISYGLFDPRGTFHSLPVSNTVPGLDYKQSASFNNVSFMGFLAPLRVRGHQFVLSAAYNRAFDEYTSQNYTVNSILPMKFQGVTYGEVPATTDISADYHGAPYTVTLGFGTRIYHSWDFGVALNILTGHGISRTTLGTLAPNYFPVNLNGQSIVYDSLTRVTDTTKYGGASITLATRYTAPKFELGFVIKSGYALRETTNRIVEQFVRYNGLVQAGSTDTMYVDNQLTKVIVPWVFGAGAAYKIRPNWIGSLDMEYRPWSGKKIQQRTQVIIRSGGDNLEVYRDSLPGWYNAFVVRAGTEYMWDTKSPILPKVPLRAGIGYVPVPGPSYLTIAPNTATADTTDFIVNTESTAMYTLSCGTGVYWQQIHLDVAYTYSTINQKYFGAAELKDRNHNFTLSFTGYF